MRILITSVFLIIVLSGICVGQSESPKLSDADQVRLLVLAELLKPWLREPDPGSSATMAKAYYFQIENKKDPSKELIEALGNGRVPFRVASRSFTSKSDGRIFDKRTREPGVLFRIYELQWKGKDEVVISAGNEEGNMSASSCDYFVKREDGGWRLAGASKCVIS